MSAPRVDPISYELLKLLLQVAWADHQVQDVERAALLRAAATLGYDAQTQAQLAAFLDGAKPLPPPNLGLLRAHRDQVAAAARRLAAADVSVLPDEAAILKVIDELLAED
jgi:hypothetical protein